MPLFQPCLLLWLLTACLSSCGVETAGKAQTITDTNIIARLPDTEIYDFTYRHTKGNGVIWELFAQKASLFDKKQLAEFTEITLNFYKNSRPDSLLTARYGQLEQDKGLMTAISNVVLKTSDHSTLYTEMLYWDNDRSLLYTPLFVKIIKPGGDIIRGVGMEADSRLEKLVIKRNVSGEFHEAK